MTNLIAESAKYFKTQLQQWQFYDKYSRYNHELGRRETWVETVDRAVSFLQELAPQLEDWEFERIKRSMLAMRAMPSMRLLAMAGEAARRDNLTIYNCSYLATDSIDAFVETLIISMAGCGVGFSVESHHTNKLPKVGHIHDNVSMYKIADSSQGWADALRYGLTTWYNGDDVMFDYSQLRPAGTVLKVKGGRASGPHALKKCLDFCRQTIRDASGRKLKPIECHDMMCAIGDCAVSGGVRRTAMISLFDWDDTEMRQAKTGNFPSIRWNANNSIVWPDDITIGDFAQQFLDMHTSMSGEPGIFNRQAAYNTMPERRQIADFGMNPCGEVFLRPCQFCNLSIAIARAEDTIDDLIDKVQVATIIGTIQSTATNFRGLRPIWKTNCEDERLLGVDITGQMDCQLVQDAKVLAFLKQVAIETNKVYAEKLGINQAAAVTCVKPSGNSSVLFDCAPGLHTRFSDYYIRNVRVSSTSPLYEVLKQNGVSMNPENGQTAENASAWVVSFPCKSPKGATTKKTAIEQCEYWLMAKGNYTEHNPSVTITYKQDELLDLMRWVWEHRGVVSGMAFLPDTDAIYEQMPYIEIDKAEYERLSAQFPKIDFSLLADIEKEDYTMAAQEIACMAGYCAF